MSVKVSVIVPCYNQAQYLDDALQSVLDQTFTDWECIIVNDGSTDNTEAIGKVWAAKDTRFRYYSKNNAGLPHTRNYGIAKATGVYILPLDADDRISSNYLQECVNMLETTPAKLVYGRVEQFGSRFGSWNLGTYTYDNLLFTNMIHCTAMYRKTDWERVGGYDETMVSGLEDWDFWVHLLKKEDLVVMLKHISFFYRIREDSMISNMDKPKEKEVKAYVFNKHTSKYFDAFTNINKEHILLKKNLSSFPYVLKRLIKLIFGFNQKK